MIRPYTDQIKINFESADWPLLREDLYIKKLLAKLEFGEYEVKLLINVPLSEGFNTLNLLLRSGAFSGSWSYSMEEIMNLILNFF